MFHLWLIFSGLIPNLVSRPLHMALVIPWIFLFQTTSGRAKFVNWGFTIVGVAACMWIAANHSALLDQYGYLDGGVQTVIDMGASCDALAALYHQSIGQLNEGVHHDAE